MGKTVYLSLFSTTIPVSTDRVSTSKKHRLLTVSFSKVYKLSAECGRVSNVPNLITRDGLTFDGVPVQRTRSVAQRETIMYFISGWGLTGESPHVSGNA